MNAQREPQIQPALELRVLSGPQAGARCLLPADGVLVIAVGEGPDRVADIVLQGEPAALLRLLPGWPAGHADVIEGSVQLGEQIHAAGSSFAWPARAVLQLGADLVLAFGEREAAIWALLPATAPAASPAAALEALPVAGAAPRWPDRWLASAGAAAAVLGLLLAAWPQAPAAPPPPDPAVQLQALQALLREPDFAGLTLDRDAQGLPLLQGRLPTLAQQSRLQTRLAARGIAVPKLQIQLDEQLAAAVEENLMLQGVVARASVDGLGEARVAGDWSALAPAALDAALLRTRAALPQLRSLQADRSSTPAGDPAPTDAPARQPTLPAAGGEPGKRVVALVSTGLPHVVTADGARYFVGALLPSGHRVAEVQSQALLLERDGQQSRIDF